MSQIDLQWFAAEDEGKTEEPSEYKLRKAREEGRLAKSQELNGTLVFFVTVIMLILLAPWIERKCEEVLTYFFRNVAAPKVDDKKFAFFCLKYFIIMTLPIAFVGMIAGIVSN
ncbi:MAG TPA: flagellar biosynthesis protein FlhB, partial [Treponema sp.]|nr:flagellar biosynthesis protein FlhB [Treponema sp.]